MRRRRYRSAADELAQRAPEAVERGADPRQRDRVVGRERLPALVVGRPEQQARRQPEAQRGRLVPERLAREHRDVVALEQRLGELRAGLDAGAAPARGRGRGRRRRRAGGTSAPAATTSRWAAAATSRCSRRLRRRARATSSGSSSTYAATVLHRGGEARPAPRSPGRSAPAARRRRAAPSGSRAKPMRQPPSAMLLLSPLVTKARSGADLGGAAERAGIVGEVAVDLVARRSGGPARGRSRRPLAPARARRACRSGCPAASARGCPGRCPAARAPASASRSAAGSGTPPACAGIGTSMTRLPASAAWAA